MYTCIGFLVRPPTALLSFSSPRRVELTSSPPLFCFRSDPSSVPLSSLRDTLATSFVSLFFFLFTSSPTSSLITLFPSFFPLQATHEAYLYCLDSLPLLLAIIAYILYYPGMFLGPKAIYPIEAGRLPLSSPGVQKEEYSMSNTNDNRNRRY